MIVKLQWPITTTEDVPQILIYNQDRSFWSTYPAKGYKKIFKNRLKFYCHAKFKNGELILGKEVRNQDW